MIVVTEQNSRSSVHGRVADASGLGIDHGVFPERMDTHLGNGRPFFRHRMIRQAEAGPIFLVIYRQTGSGMVLGVLNDL